MREFAGVRGAQVEADEHRNGQHEDIDPDGAEEDGQPDIQRADIGACGEAEQAAFEGDRDRPGALGAEAGGGEAAEVVGAAGAGAVVLDDWRGFIGGDGGADGVGHVS